MHTMSEDAGPKNHSTTRQVRPVQATSSDMKFVDLCVVVLWGVVQRPRLQADGVVALGTATFTSLAPKAV